MTVADMLDELQRKAETNEEIRQKLLATRSQKEPLIAFCRAAQELGYELYPMDVIVAGEDFHAQMKRSTNGGGENSPKLDGEDDFYEMFFASIGEP